MDVGIDEAGQHQLAADIDLGRLAGKLRLDGGDAPAGDADIDRVGRGPRPGVAEDQVEGGFRVMGRQLSWPNLAEAAEAGQLQIVCSFEAKLFKICACNLAARL